MDAQKLETPNYMHGAGVGFNLFILPFPMTNTDAELVSNNCPMSTRTAFTPINSLLRVVSPTF